MGLYCVMKYVAISDTAVTVMGEEVNKWVDKYNQVFFNGLDVVPLFAPRGQHDHDLPDTDPDNFGHAWFSIDELIDPDLSGPVLLEDDTVKVSSWADYLEGAFDEDGALGFFRELKDQGITHVFMYFY